MAPDLDADVWSNEAGRSSGVRKPDNTSETALDDPLRSRRQRGRQRAAFNDSVPGNAFEHARRSGTILVPDASLSELRRVVGRAKFDRYLTRMDRDDFLLALTRECELVEIDEVVRACRDPKDDQILEVAVNGRATTIVTGDDDL